MTWQEFLGYITSADAIQSYVTVLGAILAAMLAAIFTIKISLRHFYTKKWWEKKAEAYTKIIEYLTDILSAWMEYGEEERLIIIGKSSTENSKIIEKSIKNYSIACKSIEKTVSTGAFLISEESYSRLWWLSNQLSKDLTAYSLVKPRLSDEVISETVKKKKLIKSCIDIIKKEARKDLNIVEKKGKKFHFHKAFKKFEVKN